MCGHVDPNQLGEPPTCFGVTPNLLWGGVVHLGPPSPPTRCGWTSSSGLEVDRHGTDYRLASTALGGTVSVHLLWNHVYFRSAPRSVHFSGIPRLGGLLNGQ